MKTTPNKIKCPSCEKVSSYNQWYDISNDYNTTCPECNGVIDYEEFEQETHLSNIA